MPLRADLQRGEASGAAAPASDSGGDRGLQGWRVEKLEPRMAAVGVTHWGSLAQSLGYCALLVCAFFFRCCACALVALGG